MKNNSVFKSTFSPKGHHLLSDVEEDRLRCCQADRHLSRKGDKIKKSKHTLLISSNSAINEVQKCSIGSFIIE